MNTLYYIALFVLGISWGSFSNVLILRYDPDRNVFSGPSLSGRSHCMSCRHTLSWYELIPVLSFLFQRGKCRHCHVRLSVQYPIVEVIGGAITAGIPYFLNNFFGISSQLFFGGSLPIWYYGLVVLWILIFFVLLLITVIDFRLFLIPNELNVILGVLGVGVALIMSMDTSGLILPFRESFLRQYVMIFSPSQNVLLNHGLGALMGFGFFLALSIFTRGRGIGFGDVKLALAMGLALGWPDIALAIMLSFILGGVISVGLIIAGRKHMKDKVPFAPLFVAGFVLTYFLGYAIVKGYFGIFRLS
jgi:prepilin signal peptidase PulO-like enzyme (type II secretory pathway)